MMHKFVNGQQIPAIGFGTWISPNKEEFETALNTALKCGYRHFDTAYLYQNQPLMGEIINKWIKSGAVKREELFITSKLPMFGNNPDRVENFIKMSLKDLQLDYVDLYLMHFPVSTIIGDNKMHIGKFTAEFTDHESIWRKMEEQVIAGRAKAIGLSNFNQKQIEKILNFCKIPPSCLQNEIHVFLQQAELVNFCQKKGITVVAYAPIGTPGINASLKVLGQEEKVIPNGFQNPIITRIAKKHEKTAGQVMLRYLIERNIIPIPKSCQPRRIKENIEVFDFTLDHEDMEQIKKLDMGQAGRAYDFAYFHESVRNSPEFPF